MSEENNMKKAKDISPVNRKDSEKLEKKLREIRKRIDKAEERGYYRRLISDLNIEHSDLLSCINRTTFSLWHDDINFFYKRIFDGKIEKGDKTKISKFISSDFKDDILIVDNIYEILKIKKTPYLDSRKYLLGNKIPKIYESFLLDVDSEFYKKNDFWIRNTFEYSKYLRIRMKRNSEAISESIIINFINNLTSDKYNNVYILDWLTYFFKNLKKSNYALVLVGDKEVSEDIFFNEIIVPIFGTKFCTTIDDYKIKSESIDEIVKEKIFYHFSSLSSSISKLKKTTKLIRSILLKNRIELNKTSQDEIQSINIYGQTLMTFTTMNKAYISDIESRCSIIKIRPIEIILDKLGYKDSISLYSDIQSDLINFSNILSTHRVDGYVDDYRLERREKNKNVLNINTKIVDFINALKNHNENIFYFKKIEEKDTELYSELIHNFKENMVARSLLYTYFNIIHEDVIFSENKEFLDILKSKDDFFKQNIDKNTQYNRKKRYILP